MSTIYKKGKLYFQNKLLKQNNLKELSKLNIKNNSHEECKEFCEQNYVSSEEIVIFTGYTNEGNENNYYNVDANANIDEDENQDNNIITESVDDVELGK